MKKFVSLTMALLMMLTACSALAQYGSIPLYELYPTSPDGNAWIEIPNAYEFWIAPMSYPCGYVMDPNSVTMDRIGMFAKVPADYAPQPGDEDVSGFADNGREVLGGADVTVPSTVIERYTINDLPAVRVDMTGQGYEMIWVGDGSDMYFFMYPLADEEFAAMMRSTAASLHLVKAQTPASSALEDFQYTADENGVTITKYVGEHSRVAIPAQIDGKPVVALGDEAFYECSVTWVSVPDSVSSIGIFCFSGCTLLQTLILPNGLTEIPNCMLESCFRLLALDIPDSVTTIGEGCFWGNFYLVELRLPASLQTIGTHNFVMTDMLERFILPEGNTAFMTLDDGAVLLSGDGTHFIHYCCWQRRDSYTVPDGVQVIDSFSFADWGNLQEVIIPEGVTRVEGTAFLHARGLQRLVLPASAVDLGQMSGEGVTSIATEKVTIIAPQGSAAHAYAEQFNMEFEAAETAEDIVNEDIE